MAIKCGPRPYFRPASSDRPACVPTLKFLGTAGARFVMIEQLRASGGLWISTGTTNVLIDPGPGSIVRATKSRPKLDPASLNAIILTHCHLDHSNDINVMIEAMTEGGFKKRGTVFCTQEAIGEDGIILKYLRNFPEKIETLSARTQYSVGDFTFETSMPHIHPAETFGLKFKLNGQTVGLLTDTRYFPELKDFYSHCDLLIVCVVFAQPHPKVDHLSLPEAAQIIAETQPKKAILTHFGLTMLKADPRKQAEKLSQSLGIEVLAASDGQTLDFS